MNVAVVVVAYLVGTMPFALWLTRHQGGADLRRAGSGNLGATNVLRTAGAIPAILVLALDMSKGAAVVLFAERLGVGPVGAGMAAVAVVTGHVFSVWLRFRGGKGVATACGAYLVLSPVATLLSMGVFAAVVWGSRYVSLGSMTASVVLPPLAYAVGTELSVVTSMSAVSSLILFSHRSNVARLFAGRERRLGQRAG